LTQKQGFFDPETGNYFQTIFAKFSRVRKVWIFLKKFWTSKTEHFWNSWKQKIWKFLSYAGPYKSQIKIWNQLIPGKDKQQWRLKFIKTADTYCCIVLLRQNNFFLIEINWIFPLFMAISEKVKIADFYPLLPKQ